MSRLSTYRAKRDLDRTPEPGGSKKAPKQDRKIFVIQRHKATRLHYDVRLEMEGVLKSWAVPKGPSLDPRDRRLAMMVEDHPYDYKDFEGLIPPGNYGAGIVEIWDKGFYEPIDANGRTISEDRILKDLENGSIKFRLHGRKLKGEFALVRMQKNKAGNAWLMIKHRDENAVAGYDSEDHVARDSPINKALNRAGKPARKPAAKRKSSTARSPGKKASEPIRPMLAKLHDQPFDDDDWLFEVKWDGYRAIAETGSDVRLYSRNGNSFAAAYPDVVRSLGRLKDELVIDGEVVALDPNGLPTFQGLQNALDDRTIHIVYYAFDLLRINGEDLTALPLIERKERLQKAVPTDEHLRYSDHIIGEGRSFFAITADKGLEGIMAKKMDSPYLPGRRSSEWLKLKHHQGQEVIIGGYTEPRGSRDHFGSLLLGVHEGDRLKYVGHAGTGFTQKSLKDLMERMRPLVRTKSPFHGKVTTNTPAVWLEPDLVCNVKFTEWTKDGKMRHPVFLGLRNDKEAAEVVRETKEPPKARARSKKSGAGGGPTRDDEHTLKVGRKQIKLTNQNKVYWPDEGITKGDLIEYYDRMHRYILPYMKDRPQSLKRNPGGIADKGFYQKEAGANMAGWIHTEPLDSKVRKGRINYIICNDRATLLYLANLGCIEFNPWSSRYQRPDHPEHIIIDLDPGEKTTFDQAVEAALAVKVICDEIGAPAFCKTSGASGLHIYLPTKARYTYEELAPLAEAIAARTTDLLPGTTTIERTIAKRGGKLYVDHLQNRKGQTLACAYSVRPVPGATVSTPLDWKEVRPGLDRAAFTMRTVPSRVEARGDLFTGVRGKGLDLRKCLSRIEGF